MAEFDVTSGVARSIQVLDSTGSPISSGGFLSTDGAYAAGLYVVSGYGSRILIQTVEDKLQLIRDKSHSRLGASWSKLAEM